MFGSMKVICRIFLFAGKYSLRHQENLLPIIKSYRFFNSQIRVSVAAILLAERQGKYLVIHNRHRPECYGPIGGVYKHGGSLPQVLERIEWLPDYIDDEDRRDDMKDDLRGIIPGKYFSNFLDWFTTRKEREGEQCLYRELKEELSEGGVGEAIRRKGSDAKLLFVRRVVEGPRAVEGRSYRAQFRYFEVYKPELDDQQTKKFFDILFARAEKGVNKLCLVGQDEIQNLRIKGGQYTLAGHTQYLLSSRWHGVEPPRYWL